MKKKESIRVKLIAVFTFVFIISISIITILNIVIAKNALKDRLFESEIPAIVETIIGTFNESIMKTVSGISVIAEDEFLQEWIIDGEPENDLSKIINRLDQNTKRFNSMGSSLVLWDSGNYHVFSDGKYEQRKVQESDVWFKGFKESGLSSTINAYINHELFGEVAFINIRIDRDSEFLGLMSVSLSLTDFVNSVVNKTIGEDGSTFMIDKNGILKLDKDKNRIDQFDYSKVNGYSDNFKEITSNKSHSFQYKNENGNIIYVSSVYIPELNWYLITEASQNELFKQMNKAGLTSIILVMVLTILGALIFYLIINNITKPLQYAVTIAEAIKDGDLTTEVIVKRKDEVGLLLHSINEMKDNLADIAGLVVSGSSQIVTASSQLAEGNQDLAIRTEQQASALEETSAAIEQMNSSIRSNADNTITANKLSLDVSDKTKEGSIAVNNMIDSMKDISTSSNRISDIIDVINNIAFQTNLLALNASIEAARAGEQGKGFAVVAVEVRKLAKRSDRAASEISGIIKDSNKKVDDGVVLANNAGNMLNEINGAVKKVTVLIGEISASSQEQLSSVDQIDQTLSSLDQNTQKNAALVEEASASTEELSAQALELSNNMKFFKLGNEYNSIVKTVPVKTKSLNRERNRSSEITNQRKINVESQSFSNMINEDEFKEF